MNHFYNHLIHEFQLPLTNTILVFSLLLFIILVTPILLRKIKIPAIIGLILSGVIIGPKGLNVIGSNLLQVGGSIESFSTIGLLYIMFLAGLELDLQEFKKYKNKSFTFGFLTFAVPLMIGFPVCYYILHLNFLASLLTASMFSTHTLVAYPIVSRYGIGKNQAVAIAVGGTILTDSAVLIILAVIANSTEGALGYDFYLSLFTSLLIFTLIMVFVIPRVARWFFSKLESERNSHYIFVLSVVFFAAFLAEVAGVEGIIGAFMAGLVLNKLIPHSSTLMNRIEFVGNSLFIPFFLIAVGTVVDINVLFHGYWPLFVACVLTGLAIGSKWIAAWLTQKIYHLKSTDRQVIFGLSSAHAAATLAIIFIGYEKEIIGIDIVNATVILILITCMVASFATENVGRKLVIEKSKQDDHEVPRTKSQHIMVASNEVMSNRNLLDFSLFLSDKSITNPIFVVSIVPDDEQSELKIHHARKYLEKVSLHFASGENKVVTLATIDHNFSSGIARLSKEVAADIVVLNDSNKDNLLMRVVGDEREHLLDVCDRTVFFCQLDKPLSLHRRLVIICPPLIEVEDSFKYWMLRILEFAKELNLDLVLFSTSDTKDRIDRIMQNHALSLDSEFHMIFEMDDVLVESRVIGEEDLIIHCSARVDSVYYNKGVELFLHKFDRYFPQNNRILVYPSQRASDFLYNTYDNVSSDPIAKGVETIQKIGKIFKK